MFHKGSNGWRKLASALRMEQTTGASDFAFESFDCPVWAGYLANTVSPAHRFAGSVQKFRGKGVVMRFATGRRLVLSAAILVSAFAGQATAENMFPYVIPAQPSAPPPVTAAPPEATGTAQESAAPTDRKASRSSKRSKQTAAPAPSSPYRYYIEFRARHALSYGHTFVSYGRLTPDGRIATQTITGLHPAGDDATFWSIGHVIWVPSEVGPSDGDLEDEYISARYRIDLTAEQYESVVAYTKRLGKNSPMWHAVLYNCSAFINKIAGHMGMKTPSSLEFPANFINSLRQMNGGRRTIDTLGDGYAASTGQ